MRSLKQAEIKGKAVIVRADFDVPLLPDGQIEETLRIEKSLPTLKYVLENAACLVIISHLGRPEGRDQKLSLKIVKPFLEESLGSEITFQENINDSPSGKITLLENLRFWEGEESNDPNFAGQLAKLGSFYVNECFSVAHRQHASVAVLPTLLPSCAGFELAKEVGELEKIFKTPEHPLIAIIGGAKIETKLPAITNMAKVADKVLVGGKLMFEIDKNNLPSNIVVASDSHDNKDIGEATLKVFTQVIMGAKMIVWNGPMGLFEEEKYEWGTRELAKVIASSSGYSIVGGGDTVAVLHKEKILDQIDFVSVGGGAMLEFLEGKKLPALIALNYYGA